MAEVHVQVGMTDGFGYIGVQPPLSDKQQHLLEQAEYEDGEIPTQFKVVTPDIGEPYSETSLYGEEFWPKAIDTVALDKAAKLARVLRFGGDNVVLDETVYPIGRGYHLFGGQAERLG